MTIQRSLSTELTGNLQAVLKVKMRPFMTTMIAGPCQVQAQIALDRRWEPQLPSLKRYVPQTTSELATDSGLANPSPRPLVHATQK
jgi:hypothetical protein